MAATYKKKSKYVTIIAAGDSNFTETSVVTRTEYDRENDRLRRLGMEPSYGQDIGTIIPPKQTGGGDGGFEVEPAVVGLPEDIIRLEQARATWLQTVQGKRYDELKKLYPMRMPKETAEFRKLEQEYLEVGMTPQERVAWRRQKAEDIKADKIAEREAELEVEPAVIPNPFVKVGDRIRYIGGSKFRYQNWPEGAWLEAGVEGLVTEYHPALPPVIHGDEGIPPWAVVTWEFGGQTGIDAEYEGEQWERIRSKSPATIPTEPRTKPEMEHVWALDKGLYPTLEDEVDKRLADWANSLNVSIPNWYFARIDDIFYDSAPEKKNIFIPEKLINISRTHPEAYRHYFYFIAHEFCHHAILETDRKFPTGMHEEVYCNRLASRLSQVKPEDAFRMYYNHFPEVWKEKGWPELEQVVQIKYLPALKPWNPNEFAKYVLLNNTFTEAELPRYSGEGGKNPHGVPDEVWRQVISELDITFERMGDLYVASSSSVEVPPDMRKRPEWRTPATEPPPRPRHDGDLEWLADSPEFLSQTIDASGWRDRLDEEFKKAIARSRGRS